MLRISEQELKNIAKRKTALPQKLKESDIQRSIVEYLRFKGWFVVKIHQSLGSYPGIADLYALKDGCTVWIEVKTQTGKQSKSQKAFELAVIYHGGIYLVARSLDDIKHL